MSSISARTRNNFSDTDSIAYSALLNNREIYDTIGPICKYTEKRDPNHDHNSPCSRNP